MESSLSHYLEKLSELMRATAVTDASGKTLSLDAGAELAARLILDRRRDGGSVFVIGNGGSAAIAGHMQNDLCKCVGVRAMTFNETSLLTALANDHGYATVFERPLKLWGESGDLLIAISSSGRSESICAPARAARGLGIGIITLSGFAPENPLRQMGDVNFYIPTPNYGKVELSHSCLAHFLTDRTSAIANDIHR
jgi:D-sedoheptulose 7-phosphate isomerase